MRRGVLRKEYFFFVTLLGVSISYLPQRSRKSPLCGSSSA